MATHLNEMGRMKCVNQAGKPIACPTPRTFGCGAQGCGIGAQALPFTLPMIGGEVGLNVSDAVFGALGGKILTGVAYPVIEALGGEKGRTYSDAARIGVGVLSFLGLASERLRDSSLFLGFSFATWPQAAEPLTNWVAKWALVGLEKMTGKTFVPAGQPVAAAPAVPGTGGRRLMGRQMLGAIPRSRRIAGASGSAHEVVPNLYRPQQLIAQGTRIAGLGRLPTGLLGASPFRRPVIKSIA